MSLKEDVFNIVFFQLKLVQNLKYLSDNMSWKIFKNICLPSPVDVRIMLLIDDFYFSMLCVYKSGWLRNGSGKTWMTFGLQQNVFM